MSKTTGLVIMVFVVGLLCFLNAKNNQCVNQKYFTYLLKVYKCF